MVDRYIQIVESEDNVATALRDVDTGETVTVAIGDDEVTVSVKDDVEFGHKIALTDLSEGETIVKYGKSIGNASEEIEAGDWVHVHNVESNYGRGDLAAEEDGSAAAISE